MKARFLIFALVLAGFTSPLRADLSDAEKAEETARNSLIEHFTRFTGNKNVMGKPQEPSGKQAQIGKKTRFDSDDGNPFQSDLTYHDFSYNTTETSKDAKGQEKADRLFAFISPHGKLSGAGGSSVLERTAFQLDQQFQKEDKDEKNQKKLDADAKQGISYRSIFKIETQEVVDDAKGDAGGNNKGGGGAGGGGGANAKADAKNDKGEEKIKVERFTTREEAKPQIEKVGEDSFEEIRKEGRDKGFENDPNTLSNGVLLRYAAGAATQALWNSTLANLGQRRANKGIRAGQFPDTPQISEGVPNCQNWADTATKVLAKVQDKAQKEQLQKEIERMSKQCQEITKTSYDKINPKFVQEGKGDNETLKDGDVKKEDGFQRDMRVQLEILAKAGKSVKDVQSNWKYKPEDEKARVTIDYNEGAPKEANLTVKEQIDTYNNQLKEASKGYSEVNSRLPPNLQTNPDEPMKYQIQSESRSVMDINYAPVSAMDEAGVTKSMVPNSAKSYEELRKSQAQ